MAARRRSPPDGDRRSSHLFLPRSIPGQSLGDRRQRSHRDQARSNLGPSRVGPNRLVQRNPRTRPGRPLVQHTSLRRTISVHFLVGFWRRPYICPSKSGPQLYNSPRLSSRGDGDRLAGPHCLASPEHNSQHSAGRTQLPRTLGDHSKNRRLSHGNERVPTDDLHDRTPTEIAGAEILGTISIHYDRPDRDRLRSLWPFVQARPCLWLQTPGRQVEVGARFRVLVLGLCLVFGILIASFAVSAHHDKRSYPIIQATLPSQASFDYIVIIVMNNASAKQVYGSSAAPYLNSLASTYGYATAYSDVEAAVSDPNYLALIGGSTFGLTADCYPTQCSVSDKSIVDSIEGAGLTWKAWAEDYPVSQGCSLSPSNTEYNSKHFPFLYFQNIVNDPARCDNLLRANSVVTSSIETDDLFLKSLGSTSAANYNWLTPNQCDDIHDCSLSTGDKYLSQLVPKILSSTVFTTQNAALFVTFAESSGSSVGNVPAIWAGPVPKTKFQSSKSYNHYSLLTTIETAWGLSSLTSEDGSASAMTEFFKNLAPQTSLSYAPTHPMGGDSISFNSTAIGGIPPYTFSWNFGESTSNVRGGTSLPNTVTHTYTSAGTYTVTVNATDTNGKIGSASATVTVAAPLAVTVSGPSSGIVGVSVSFSAVASGGTSPYSFSWNFGDGTSLATGSAASHKYAVAGGYAVRVNATDTKGRLASASVSITINAPLLTVAVTTSGSSEVGLAVNLTATASGGTQPYVSFIWNFDDGSTGSGNSVAHVYAASGTYSVTITVEDSAGITATSSSHSVAVAARLQVSSVHAVPNPSEAGYSISLSATTSGGVSPVSCNWNFGDGSPPSSGCSITRVYANPANYTVTVTATDNLGVSATNSTTITVSPKLTVAATATTPNPVVGQSLTFTATTNNGVGVATCSWNFGDGATGTGCTATHAYSAQGTFTAKLIATDTLSVTATASVTVNIVSTLGVSLNASPNPTEHTVSPTFTATAAGGTPPYTSYSWTFGDGTTATATAATTSHT